MSRLLMGRTPCLTLALVIGVGVGSTLAGDAHSSGKSDQPIVIARQGSFFVGGRTVTAPGVFDSRAPLFPPSNDGQTFEIDHLYAQFQIPPGARHLPLVMVHGGGQTGKTWEATPDGRDGYQTIFLRRGFGVYIVDFPRRARAGFPSFTGPVGDLNGQPILPGFTVRLGDQAAFNLFRLGIWPDFFPNVQFPSDPAALRQFNQQNIPFFADDPTVVSDTLAALFDEIGPAILLTHSQSGQFGWLAAIKSQNVKAIVSYEPVAFVVREGDVPPPTSPLPPVTVSRADFEKLTRIPIQIVYGDNIPASPTGIPGLDLWITVTAAAAQFSDAVNRSGGDASIVRLPEVGLSGNTHFPFSDLNNLEAADLLSGFLHDKRLDKRTEEPEER